MFLNYYSTVHYAFRVSKNCFFPPPKIESAIVILDLKEPPKVSDEEKFFVLTRSSFEHRRKMLRASLRDLYEQEAITQALTKLDIDPQARPETLSLEQFIMLFEKLQQKSD